MRFSSGTDSSRRFPDDKCPHRDCTKITETQTLQEMQVQGMALPQQSSVGSSNAITMMFTCDSLTSQSVPQTSIPIYKMWYALEVGSITCGRVMFPTFRRPHAPVLRPGLEAPARQAGKDRRDSRASHPTTCGSLLRLREGPLKIEEVRKEEKKEKRKTRETRSRVKAPSKGPGTRYGSADRRSRAIHSTLSDLGSSLTIQTYPQQHSKISTNCPEANIKE
jgi:hypothetical protein